MREREINRKTKFLKNFQNTFLFFQKGILYQPKENQGFSNMGVGWWICSDL
jgi:hypothetical protein